MPQKLLELESLDVTRGGILILRNINLSVEKGEVIALIGPNGAGKTTLFSSIAGLHKITNGSIKFDNKPIHKERQEEIMQHISLVSCVSLLNGIRKSLDSIGCAEKYDKPSRDF